jgi:hypothetical protein
MLTIIHLADLMVLLSLSITPKRHGQSVWEGSLVTAWLSKRQTFTIGKVWSGVARMWYNKAADKSPKVGWIQHQLAVLTRPDILRNSYIIKLTFKNAQESIIPLFVSRGTRKLPVHEILFLK